MGKRLRGGESSEGMIVSWIIVIMALSAAGSLATGMGPFEFFVLTALFLMMGFLILGLLLGAVVGVFKLMQAGKRGEHKTLMQLVRDEYNWDSVKDGYKVIYDFAKSEGVILTERYHNRLPEPVRDVFDNIAWHGKAVFRFVLSGGKPGGGAQE